MNGMVYENLSSCPDLRLLEPEMERMEVEGRWRRRRRDIADTYRRGRTGALPRLPEGGGGGRLAANAQPATAACKNGRREKNPTSNGGKQKWKLSRITKKKKKKNNSASELMEEVY